MCPTLAAYRIVCVIDGVSYFVQTVDGSLYSISNAIGWGDLVNVFIIRVLHVVLHNLYTQLCTSYTQ